MKTIFTLTIALLISSASFAQLTSGSYVLGGDIAFSYSNSPSTTSDVKNTSFRISPGIGKFISEKYLLDVGLEYSYGSRSFSQQFDYTQNTKNHFYGARFGLTRYFPIIDRLYFSLGAHLIPSYSTSRRETSISGNSSESTSSSLQMRLNVSPGLTYFLNRKWMLYTYVGVLNYGLNYNLDTKETGHNLNFNLRANSFGVGVLYVIGKGTNE